MNKKMICGLCFFLFGFFLFSNSVVALECNYQKEGNKDYWESSATVTIDETKWSAKAVITSFDNKKLNNKENVLNWDDVVDYVKETGTCPNYAVITYYKGEINGAKFHLAVERADAQEIYQKLNEVKHSMYGRSDIALYEGFHANETDNEYYYDRLTDLQEELEQYFDALSVDRCLNTYKEMSKKDALNACIQSFKDSYKGYESAVNQWINDGVIDANDDRVQDFFDTYESYDDDAEDYLDDLESSLDELSTGGGDEPFIKGSGDTDINMGNLCSTPNVARTLKFLGLLIYLVKIAVPLLIIILGSIDFGKAMIAGKGDEIPKKIPVLAKRFIVGVIIFLIPSIIDFLFGVIDTYSDTMKRYENCWTCLLNPDDCNVNN